jgi:hypothetical protein
MANSLKLHRRWLTFSLRSFFIAMTIFSIWLGVAVNRARQQREAVKQLEAICGKPVHDWEPERRIFGLPAPPPRTHPPGPSWLRRLLGDEFFQEVRDVELWVCSPADKLFFLAAPSGGPSPKKNWAPRFLFLSVSQG